MNECEVPFSNSHDKSRYLLVVLHSTSDENQVSGDEMANRDD